MRRSLARCALVCAALLGPLAALAPAGAAPAAAAPAASPQGLQGCC